MLVAVSVVSVVCDVTLNYEESTNLKSYRMNVGRLKCCQPTAIHAQRRTHGHDGWRIPSVPAEQHLIDTDRVRDKRVATSSLGLIALAHGSPVLDLQRGEVQHGVVFVVLSPVLRVM